MTGAEFLTLLMGRLGGRTSATTRATALLEAKLVQQTELEEGAFLPWFLINRSLTGTLSVGARELAVPTGFIRELDEEDAVLVTNPDGKEVNLVKKPYNELRNWHGLDATADVPENYSLSGDKFLIFPLPNLVLATRYRVYAGVTVVNDDAVETLWTKHAADLLLAYTGYNMATKHLAWPEKAAEFSADKSTAMSRLIAMNTAREEASLDRAMG